MVIDTLATSILNAAGSSAVKVLADAVNRENLEQLRRQHPIKAKFATTESIVGDSIARHVKFTKTWSNSVNFSELKKKKEVSKIYVDVDTYLVPIHLHASEKEKLKTTPLIETIASSNDHCVILGGAGAGKTTAIKKIASDFFSKGKALLNYNFPIVIELRDLPDSTTTTPLYERLRDILGLRIVFENADLPKKSEESILRQVISAYVDRLRAIILLDGFDEISNSSTRLLVLENFNALSNTLRSTRVILTSRSSDFRFSEGEASRYEIAPLSVNQIHTFARKWLNSDAQAADFLAKVKASPFADTTIRPLTIAHLCAIYERIGDIPEKPKSVYRRVVNLLLKEWDEQRRVRRTSAYSDFDVDRKLEFLAHLAFTLTTEAQALRFDSRTLQHIYKKIHSEHGLPERDANHVISEIESHNGLIIKSGYDRYEFAHKSIQEFLGADYIVRLPSLAGIFEFIHELPNEIAIATSLSSKPGAYLCEVMIKVRSAPNVSSGWYETFSSRLILEKAELAIGHNIFTTIATLQLAAMAPYSTELYSLLKRMIPENSIESLYQFYNVTSNSDGHLTLTRNKKNDQFALPNELVVSAKFLSS